MLRNYLTVAVRNMIRQKGYAFVNIAGLAIGMACSILILLYVRHELSYDRYHEKPDQIVRIENMSVQPDGTRTPNFCSIAPSFVPLIENGFPAFQSIARVFPPGRVLLQKEDRRFNEDRLYFTEHDIFRVLHLPLVAGNPDNCLKDPGTVVLSRSLARKIFGERNPMGQTLRIDGEFSVVVTGILEDPRSDTHLPIRALVGYETLRGLYGSGENDYFHGMNNFTDNVTYAYARLRPDVDRADLERRIMETVDRMAAARPDGEGRVAKPSTFMTLGLRPVTDIHLHSHSRNELEPGGDSRMVWMFTLVALVILLTACTNFVNLSTARASKRAREVGLRKVVGAGRARLIFQFIGESVAITLVAGLISVALAELLLPLFKSISGIRISSGFMFQPGQLLVTGGVFLLTGLVAGVYPAFYLSVYRPAEILRGAVSGGRRGARGRKILVVFQFSVTIALIIGMIMTYRQIRFLKRADLGLDREHILLADMSREFQERWEAVKQQLVAHPDIAAATASKRAPGGRLLDDPGFEIQLDGEWRNQPFSMPHNRVDLDFFRTYHVPMVAGREFSKDHPTDLTEAVILNETAARKLGKRPAELIGVPVRYGDNRWRVIGVCRDFHYESLHNRITPVMTYIRPAGHFTTVAIRVSGRNRQAVMDHLGQVWQQFQPGIPLDIQYLDDRFRALYRNEERTMAILGLFTVLAIVIGCLGMLGLVAYAVERRRREISIRKVLGCSPGGIVGLLSGDYLRLMLVANIIAWPVAWFMMNRWLGQFAYRVSSGWWVYVLSAVLALLIAQLTVGIQALKGASTNPADALRAE